jgi:hypothetical protein
MAGATEVKIHGEYVAVKAEVSHLEGFSGPCRRRRPDGLAARTCTGRHAAGADLRRARRAGDHRRAADALRMRMQSLAMGERPAQQGGDALLDALAQRVLAAAEEHAVAGARGMDLAAAGVVHHCLGTAQARARSGDERVALIVGQQAPEQHDARMVQREQHLHLAVAGIHACGRAIEVGLGHRQRLGQRRRVRPVGALGQELAERVFEPAHGHLVVPAAGAHGRQHVFGAAAGPGLLDDPLLQLGGDDLLRHGPRLWRAMPAATSRVAAPARQRPRREAAAQDACGTAGSGDTSAPVSPDSSAGCTSRSNTSMAVWATCSVSMYA